MLRNDWVWSRLSEAERAFVKAHNEYWNNNARGYKDPAAYQGQRGQSFFTPGNRSATWKGREIEKFLLKNRPRRVLEIGPGSGYYSRQIVDQSFVEGYAASDINSGFLDFIESGIREHPRGSSVKFERATISQLHRIRPVDAILVLSALHHVPDRPEFVNELAKSLNPGGVIFFYEPSHSLLRILELALSYARHGWYRTSVVRRRNNYMTHHFCTVGETMSIARITSLRLLDLNLKCPFPLPKIRVVQAPFAREMTFTLRKNL
jgi:2-polyprenyl-3-methyl-5-hydroxy-6-metoxy-1,4-benzoquinol methylase